MPTKITERLVTREHTLREIHSTVTTPGEVAEERDRLREELAECQADAKASHAMYDRMAREFRSMLQSVDDLTAENAELRAALGIPNPGADT